MEKQLLELAQKTVEKLRLRKMTLSSAESCTGGMFSELITSVSGASEVFELSVVSYSSRIKNKILCVDKDILDTLGAVSKATAIQMADNVRKLSSSDIAVSVTGVAGPAMSEGKAVGTVYIAVSTQDGTFAKLLNIEPVSRQFIRQKACMALLEAVLEAL